MIAKTLQGRRDVRRPELRGLLDDALICLRLLGVVSKGPRGRWLPGAWALEELPLPAAELEATWARERRKRVRHAHRYR